MKVTVTHRYIEKTNSIRVFVSVGFPVRDNRMFYQASAPADSITSFSGSALPFPNKDHAFRGATPRNEGTFLLIPDTESVFKGTFEMDVPNTYYESFDSTDLVPPQVVLKYVPLIGGKEVVFKHTFKNLDYVSRTLTYPKERKGPEFYAEKTPIYFTTQDDLLRQKGYPTSL